MYDVDALMVNHLMLAMQYWPWHVHAPSLRDGGDGGAEPWDHRHLRGSVASAGEIEVWNQGEWPVRVRQQLQRRSQLNKQVILVSMGDHYMHWRTSRYTTTEQLLAVEYA